MDTQMVRAEGMVIRVEPGYAVVQLRRQGGCGRCGEPGGCGVSEDTARACTEYRLENACSAQPGERVSVVLPQGQALLAAALVYVLPLLFMLLAAACGTALGWAELSVAAAVFFALLVCVAGLWLSRRHGLQPVRRPHIDQVLP